MKKVRMTLAAAMYIANVQTPIVGPCFWCGQTDIEGHWGDCVYYNANVMLEAHAATPQEMGAARLAADTVVQLNQREKP